MATQLSLQSEAKNKNTAEECLSEGGNDEGQNNFKQLLFGNWICIVCCGVYFWSDSFVDVDVRLASRTRR
jgi:hypothetical protein